MQDQTFGHIAQIRVLKNLKSISSKEVSFWNVARVEPNDSQISIVVKVLLLMISEVI